MQRSHFVLGLILTFVITAGSWCETTNAQSGPRKLARGVLKTIPEDLNPRDMFTLPKPLPGLNAARYNPETVAYRETLHGQSQKVVLFRDNVWQVEFAFVGLRQAKLQVPNDKGVTEARNVWYLIYRLRDTKKTLTFEQVKQHPDFDHIKYDLREGENVPAQKRKLLPRFTLEGWVVNAKGDAYEKVVYRDQLSPIIVEQIRAREDKNQILLDRQQISGVKIPVANNSSDPGVWGVAIWEDVNPNIDYVSVYAKGLTNAFRLADDMEGPSKLKTLQLNFWRSGDSVGEYRDDVAFGIPLVDDPRQQALICQRYDLPGPVIRAYFVNKIAKRNVLTVEADAQVSLRTFESAIAPMLDKGQMPANLAKAFQDAGINVGGGQITTQIAGAKWSMKIGEDEYILALEPQFWEPDFGKIRFIKSLDHIWIYR